MGRLTLVTGGAASGKSSHALRLASRCGERILFVATCVPRDDEMRAKVARHRTQRPASWTTVERTRQLAQAFQAGFDAAVVDCLTLLVSQLLIEDAGDAEILAEVKGVCDAARQAAYPTVLVTNEVGLGVVPDSPLGRRFRELAGRANQLAAGMADDVDLVVCGIPIRIKHAG